MTKKIITTFGIATLTLLNLGQLKVNAEDTPETNKSQASTKGTMTFKVDDSNVDPSNPIVNKPNNPSELIPTNPETPDNPFGPSNPGESGNGKMSFYINFAPNLTFKDVEIKGSTMEKYAEPLTFKGLEEEYTPFIQITDNRGTNSGWELTVKGTTFKDDQTNEELKGVTLQFGNTHYYSLLNPDNIEVSNLDTPIRPTNPKLNTSKKRPIIGKQYGTDLNINGEDTAQLMYATENQGAGSWILYFGGEYLSGPPSMPAEDGGYSPRVIYTGIYEKDSGVKATIPASSLPKIGKTYTSDLIWTLQSTP